MQGLFQVGLNHLNSPVHFRERMTSDGRPLEALLDELWSEADLDEVAILSTCSRFEVVARSRRPHAARELVTAWFERRLGGAARTHLAAREGAQAVTHLFRVAAGLDSWILGESEILGQVKKAYQTAAAGDFTGPCLNRVFQSALAAGKAVRAQTGIQDGIHSIGGAAALLARRIFGDAGTGRTIVFGAGQAAEAVCRHLAAKKFSDVLIANRTPQRAQDLAREIGGRAVAFAEGLEALAETEVAILSVSSPEPVIRKAWLSDRLPRRRKSLFLIDLGLPRNVEPGCADLPGVYVYGLDDLKNVVADSMGRKESAKKVAEAIAADAARDCVAQLRKAAALAAGGPSAGRRSARPRREASPRAV
jgi:glutamyl-tRNA reductase